MIHSATLVGGSSGAIVIPDDLRERDQWVLRRYEDRNGKKAKVPYQVGGRRASSTDSRTWTRLDAHQ
jgi:primase-polymerase (primpol)-like protein